MQRSSTTTFPYKNRLFTMMKIQKQNYKWKEILITAVRALWPKKQIQPAIAAQIWWCMRIALHKLALVRVQKKRKERKKWRDVCLWGVVWIVVVVTSKQNGSIANNKQTRCIFAIQVKHYCLSLGHNRPLSFALSPSLSHCASLENQLFDFELMFGSLEHARMSVAFLALD